jgi:hypothetical protein
MSVSLVPPPVRPPLMPAARTGRNGERLEVNALDGSLRLRVPLAALRRRSGAWPELALT